MKKNILETSLKSHGTIYSHQKKSQKMITTEIPIEKKSEKSLQKQKFCAKFYQAYSILLTLSKFEFISYDMNNLILLTSQ